MEMLNREKAEGTVSAPAETGAGKKVLNAFLILLTGFIAANALLFDQISPFALGVVSAFPGMAAVICALGAAAGHGLILSGTMMVRSMVAVIGAAAVKATSARLLSGSKSNWVSPLAAVLCSASTGLVILLSQGFSADGALLFLFEAVLAGATAACFGRGLEALNKGFVAALSNKKDLICIGLMFSVLLISVGRYEFFSIAPARIIGICMVLAAAYLAAEGGGAVAGICAGTALAAASQSSTVAVVFGAAGLIAGIVSPLGRLACGLAFGSVAAVVAVVSGESRGAAMIIESLAAMLIFSLIPAGAYKKITDSFNVEDKKSESSLAAKLITDKLSKTADAVETASRCIDTVSKGLSKVAPQENESAIARTKAKTCEMCIGAEYCWEEHRDETVQVFETAEQKLGEEGMILTEFFKAEFDGRCPRAEELAESMNRIYSSSLAMRSAGVKTEQYREIVCRQFRGVSEILKDVSVSLNDKTTRLPETTKRVRSVLEEEGIRVLQAECFRDKNSRIQINAQTGKIDDNINISRVVREIARVTGTQFNLPQAEETDGGYNLNFMQKIVYYIDIGTVQLSSEKDALCGDYFSCFSGENGNEVIILCDGMGTGGRAAVDSAMATELFSKMVEAGLSFECALNMTNSALLIKSDDESLSTIDVASIDMYSGRVELFKAGAAASFVRRRGRVAALEKASLPAGILQDVEFARLGASLSDNDILLMVSDGAITGDDEYISEILGSWTGGKAQLLAEQIAEHAAKSERRQKKDDITVIAAVLRKF